MEHDEKKLEEKTNTILVIDDEWFVREVLSAMLQNTGYAMVSAEDGLSGMKEYLRAKPDLVILDIMMPRMSGWDFLKWLKHEQKDSSTPVIIFTGYAEYKTDFLLLGAHDYIAKPPKYGELLLRIDKLLSGSHLEVEVFRLRNLVSALTEERKRPVGERIEQLSGKQKKEIDKYRDICGAVAHSLKGEFLHIGNSVKWLRGLGDNSSDIQEECDMIERSVEYSQILLRRLLDYLNMGKSSVEPIDVLELLRKTELLASPRLPSSVKLETTIDPNVKGRTVSANPEQLMGVLLELIHNATNALREKGGTIGLHLEDRNGKLAISVKDDGPGIPEELRKGLFKKQVSSKKGLGLGLFLCDKVINALGGKLNLETSSEEGTEFTILLPVANDEKEL